MSDIKTINDLLPVPLIANLDSVIKNTGWNYGWKSNPTVAYSHWNMGFSQRMRENGIDISSELIGPVADAWNYIKTLHFPDHSLLRCYANGHTYGVEGYPHTDSLRLADKTLIVYMNNLWKREWGGETLIYNNDNIVHAELPRRNKALVFPGHMWHTSRGVTRICPELRISLMFKIVDNKNVDPNRNKIQQFLESVGADKISHTGSTLIIHLMRTYDLLKKANQSQDICSAGALHSIFGTTIFKTSTLDKSRRQQVVDLIGERATELVEQFSTLDNRLVVLESNTTDPQYLDLCIIECANLLEQKSLEKYPNLLALWHRLNKST